MFVLEPLYTHFCGQEGGDFLHVVLEDLAFDFKHFVRAEVSEKLPQG